MAGSLLEEPLTDHLSLSPLTVFLLQIVDRDGQVALLPGGGRLEEDLVVALKGAILKSFIPPDLPKLAFFERLFVQRYLEKVGWGAIQRRLNYAVEDGVRTTINLLKMKTRECATAYPSDLLSPSSLEQATDSHPPLIPPSPPASVI